MIGSRTIEINRVYVNQYGIGEDYLSTRRSNRFSGGEYKCSSQTTNEGSPGTVYTYRIRVKAK